MADMILFALGIIIGWCLGFLAGRTKPSKPWSELTEKEKRIRKILIFGGLVILIVMLILGIAASFLAY